ncbi:HlyD family secretion protein [Stenotrophomonas mori]|uniref:HlyD family secretion protein n=1 Tax=Stenotrophomonas mori TaxID=2871096 RepID=A0ABT0SIE0_9GAMM|nr:HlyD family secretion protein [Stenotrophomonas mori]MCL7715076.1 HlyD family secretion protein [Stenotrophomonas mori]
MTITRTSLHAGLALGVLVLAAGAWLLLREGTHQRTNNAYVVADYTLVAPKIPGFVSAVEVLDNQAVRAGDVLARIDDRDYRVAVQAAQADLAGARARLVTARAALAQQGALIAQARASVDVGRSELTLAHADQQRYRELAREGAGSVRDAQQALSRQAVASAQLQQGQAALQAARQRTAILDAGVRAAQAAVQLAEAAQARAELDLSHTVLRAPIDGTVGRRAVRVGAYLTPGTPVAAVVPLEQAFVVANFQETQMARMRAGQQVELTVDVFPGTPLRGHVDSIAPATGVTFAAVAPENATGNFTKVVQRIPVKIVLAPGQPLLEQLRAGMSVEVRVDLASGPHAHSAQRRPARRGGERA